MNKFVEFKTRYSVRIKDGIVSHEDIEDENTIDYVVAMINPDEVVAVEESGINYLCDPVRASCNVILRNGVKIKVQHTVQDAFTLLNTESLASPTEITGDLFKAHDGS